MTIPSPAPSKPWPSEATAPHPTQTPETATATTTTTTTTTTTNSPAAAAANKPTFTSEFKMFDLEPSHSSRTQNTTTAAPSEEHICRYAKQMSLTMNGAGMTKQMRARLLAEMIREEHLRGLARDAVR
ncbi:hypothetical protein BZA77DRAFT_352059 [Pyronema omphalodes]|nr:hypothetical protein BZA77DRAFT_352059 [Pyronema omphalodes]